jgi:hypothetical protein
MATCRCREKPAGTPNMFEKHGKTMKNVGNYENL